MKRILIQYRREFFTIAFLFFVAVICLTMSGCAVPAWISNSENVIDLVGASFASIAAFVAGLTGNTALAELLTEVSAWITKVQGGVSGLQSLISQYKVNPTTGLLGEIESALTDLQQNVAQDFSGSGLPASVLSVISGIAAEADALLSEWSNAITGVKSATTSAEVAKGVANISALADNLPTRIASYSAAVNTILSTPTGDAEVDAALAKAPRI